MALQIVSILLGIILLFGSLYFFLNRSGKPKKPVRNDTLECLLTKTDANELDKIRVSLDIQDLVENDGLSKILITAVNTGQTYYTGNITVKSMDVNGDCLGWEMLPFYELAPGEKEYGSCWLKTTVPPLLVAEITGQFE